MNTQFVNDKPLTLDCDLYLGRENQNFVCDIPSDFVLSFCKVCLNSLY